MICVTIMSRNFAADNSVVLNPRNILEPTEMDRSSNAQNQADKPWLIKLCNNCYDGDYTDSWEPPFWKRLCPLPICPPYRKFAQYLSFLMIFLLIWLLIYIQSPRIGSPTGPLCNLVGLIFMSYVCGTLLFKLTTLPALIGMLIMGILLQNVGYVNLDDNFISVTAELRRIAVVIILARAGLSLDAPTLKKMYAGILKLGFIPWIVECVVIAILSNQFLSLPWDWAFLLSSIIASVSPAVVVPCFIRLRSEGYGVAKGIPTLVLAAASIDDTTSIAVYGIISSIMFSSSTLANNIIQGPLSIIGGIGYGLILGYILKYVPERNDQFVNILRVLLLFCGTYAAILGSSIIGFAGAGPLAIITAAFVSSYHWSEQGWDVKNNPASNAFRLMWVVFEPTLFGITGAQIKLNELDPHIVGIGAACLFAGVIIRIISTIIICYGSNFNMKEKFFIGLSWMAKATVQAALGPLALQSVSKMNGTKDEFNYAKIVMMICILSIILTAPLGAILISITGPILLSKSSSPRQSFVDQIQKNNATTINARLNSDDAEKEHSSNEDNYDNETVNVGNIVRTNL